MLPVSGAEQFSAAGPRSAPSGDLRERRVLQVGQPGAVLAGQEEVPQPLGPGRRAKFREHRDGGPRPAVLQCGELLVEHRLGRVDVGVHELEQLRLAVPRSVRRRRIPSVSSANRGQSGGDQRLDARADLPEPLADRLAMDVPVVNALENHRRLERGEGDVEAEIGQVAPAVPGVEVEYLAPRGDSRARRWPSARRRAGPSAGRRRAARRRSAGRPGWPSPSRAPRPPCHPGRRACCPAGSHRARSSAASRRACWRPAARAVRRCPRPCGYGTRQAASSSGAPAGRGSPPAGRNPPARPRRDPPRAAARACPTIRSAMIRVLAGPTAAIWSAVR